MPSCNIFQEKIRDFEASIAKARVELASFLEHGDEGLYDQLRAGLAHLRQERERFLKEEYTPKVKLLVGAWYDLGYVYPQARRDIFISNISISEGGRVTLGSGSTLSPYITISPSGKKFHFPHLVENATIGFRFEDAILDHVDYPSTVDDGTGAKIASMAGLKKITRFLYIGETPLYIPFFPNLEEVGSDVNLNIRPIDNFRGFFPRLRQVGMDRNGVSFFLYSYHANIKEQLEELRREGSLEFEGEIVMRNPN